MTRILLVDDEVGLTRLLRRTLEADGRYEVRVEHTGTAGLHTAREFAPDLILLDVVMPGMSGRELAAALGREPGLAAVPIVFLTALPPGSGRDDGGRLDGHRCLEKPLHAAAVLEAIEGTLRAQA